MKIFVRAPNWIGDCVMAGPAIASLKQHFPEADIWIAANDWVSGLFHHFAGLGGVLSLPSGGGFSGMKTAAEMLRKERFDAGLLLTNSFHSALMLARANIPQRWGYKSDSRGFFLTRRVPRVVRDNPSHHVYYYLDLLDSLGFTTTEAPRLSLNLNRQASALMKERLLRQGWDGKAPLVILNPGAQYGPAKRWPADRFQDLACKLLKNRHIFLVITGSSAEIPLAKEIAEGINPSPVILSGNTSLEELLAVIGISSLFITNDTGPMHIANALGIPLIALFGPTDHRATGPFQQPATVIRQSVPCWPCWNRVCPFDHRCMREISPEQVLKESIVLLDNKAKIS